MACGTSLGNTKFKPMPITATVLPPVRTVSIRMPPNLSRPTTKSFDHLICTGTPKLTKACWHANATTNANALNSACVCSNVHATLNVKHSPTRLCQLLPCLPRPCVCSCTQHKQRCTVSGCCFAFANNTSLLDAHSCHNSV